MSGFFPLVAAGSTPQARNPQRDYSVAELHPDGLQITNANGNNAISAYSAINAVPAGGAAGIILTIGQVSSQTGRFQARLRAGGSSIIVPDYHFQLASLAFTHVRIPILIPASTTLELGLRSSSNNTSAYFGCEFIEANSLDSPGISTMTALNVDTTNTQPSSTTVPNTDTWTVLYDDSDSNNPWSALMAVITASAAPAAGSRANFSLGIAPTGASAGTETTIFQSLFNIQTTAPYVHGGNFPMVEHPIPAGYRISAKVTVTTSNSDLFRVGLWGLV